MSRFAAAVVFMGTIFIGLSILADPAAAQLTKDQKFVKSIRDGDLRAIEVAVVNGANVDARDSDGKPILVLSAEKGRRRVVAYLLRNRAKVNATDRASGDTALMVAAERGDTRIVDLLLTSRADLNEIDRRGETALMKAAGTGKRRVVRMLIKAGADYSLEDYTGRTAMVHARDARRQSIVTMLTAAGADR